MPRSGLLRKITLLTSLPHSVKALQRDANSVIFVLSLIEAKERQSQKVMNTKYAHDAELADEAIPLTDA